MDKKLFDKKKMLELASVPANTFNRWLRQGKIVPAAYDDKGKPLFTEEQVEQAKALHKPENYHRRAGTNDKQGTLDGMESENTAPHDMDAESDSNREAGGAVSQKSDKSSIEGTAADDGQSACQKSDKQPAENDSETAAPMNAPDTEKITVKGEPKTISGAAYRTMLLHVGKISNGQRDFIGVLRKELQKLLSVDAAGLIAEITATQGNCLDVARKFLAQFNFVVEDDGARYQLVGNSLDLIPDTQNQNQIVEGVDNASGVTELIPLEARADRIRQLIVDVQKGVIAIGFELIAAKKQVGHGNWAEWLQNEFEWDIRTAQNYMRVAERFGNAKTFSHLGKSKLIKLLALPEGDENAFIEAQANAGKPIESQSARDVQKAVKQWNQRGEHESNHAPTSAQEPRQGVQSGAVDTEYTPAEIDSEASANETADNESFSSSREEEAVADVDSDNPRQIFAQGSIEGTADDEFELTMEDPPADIDSGTAKKLPPIAQNKNGTVEWYTPSEYIKAAREVMGGIDLDPASSEIANLTVKATKFFTVNDNGLLQEWRGRVWLNPPFASGLIEQFVDKLVSEFGLCHVTEAVALVDNATETRWFRKLTNSSNAIVFTVGRINFRKGGTFEEGSPTRGQAFFHFGSDPDKFYQVFSRFGWCCRVVRPESLEEEKSITLF